MSRNSSGQSGSTEPDEVSADPIAPGATGSAKPAGDPADRIADAATRVELSPIVAAAYKGVAEIFASVAAQMPDLIKAQAPPDSPIPAFTRAMIGELMAQVERTLGPPARIPDRDP